MKYYFTSFLVVPVFILITMFTHGRILPSIKPVVWDIEDSPFLVIALLGIFLAYRGFKLTRKKGLFFSAAGFNLAWLVNFAWAIYTLWGEKV